MFKKFSHRFYLPNVIFENSVEIRMNRYNISITVNATEKICLYSI